jgi:hypothetical protein
MMLRNGALVRSTAGGFVGSPSGAGEGGVEQNDDEQTDAGVGFAAAMLKGNLHVLRQRGALPHHYIVTRHSLQDSKITAWGTTRCCGNYALFLRGPEG